MLFGLKISDINSQTISFGAFRLYKNIVHQLGRSGTDEKTIVPILGIQRSGTSMLYWIFERDLGTKVYRESSELSSQDKVEKIRLDPLPLVKKRFDRQRASLVVFKPLVESQRAHDLFDAIPGARALWTYRHYQDVASSNLKAFGMDNGVKDLQPFVRNDPANWRSQNSSEETREIIRSFFSEDMNPYDAAALFWWARCRLFFDLGLDSHPRVMLCRYEDLVTEPSLTMRRIYTFLGRQYPGDQIIRDVNPQSIGKGRTSKLSQDIESLCTDLLVRLDQVNNPAI